MSDISREGRMDAGFHLVAQQHAETVAKLRRSMSEDEARDVVLGLPNSVLTKKMEGRSVLDGLVRGSTPRFGLRELKGVIAEYPHLTLAILSQHLDDAIVSARAEIADIEKSVAFIQEVARIGAEGKTS